MPGFHPNSVRDLCGQKAEVDALFWRISPAGTHREECAWWVPKAAGVALARMALLFLFKAWPFSGLHRGSHLHSPKVVLAIIEPKKSMQSRSSRNDFQPRSNLGDFGCRNLESGWNHSPGKIEYSTSRLTKNQKTPRPLPLAPLLRDAP